MFFLSDMRRTLFLLVFCGLLTSGEAAPEPQIFAENVISTADDESHPAFTPDGKTLYFLKNDP
jgi:WD40 repeat protein